MSSFLRTMMATRLAPALRTTALQSRANLNNMPAKHPLGLAETVFGLTCFSLTLLGPMGWILSHLEVYKKKE